MLDQLNKIFNMAKEGKLTRKKQKDILQDMQDGKQEQIGEMRIPTDELQKEVEALENQDVVPGPDESTVTVVDGATQTKVSEEEADKIKNPADYDIDYLEYSSEAVGYPNREEQWNTYRTVVGFIPEGESILDFGCARGDFERFYQTEYQEKIEYIGVDMNKQLIDAGLKVYEKEVDVRHMDWFKLDKNLKMDWCINVGSCDLRYDADIKQNDTEYMQSTIETMYHHANNGIIAIFASDQSKTKEDGLINRNAGEVLNWAQTKFGTVALDHTISSDVFVLIIYKK